MSALILYESCKSVEMNEPMTAIATAIGYELYLVYESEKLDGHRKLGLRMRL